MAADMLPWPQPPPFKMLDSGILVERPFAEEMLHHTEATSDDRLAELHNDLVTLLEVTENAIVLGERGLRHVRHYVDIQRRTLEAVPLSDRDAISIGRHIGWAAIMKTGRTDYSGETRII